MCTKYLRRPRKKVTNSLLGEWEEIYQESDIWAGKTLKTVVKDWFQLEADYIWNNVSHHFSALYV